MKIVETKIPDVKIIEPKIFSDDRGFFMETFRRSLFNQYCSEKKFVQDNHSKSMQGTLRGLHYQTENTQGKLVRVTQGEVYDVAVDLRKNSRSYGEWVGVLLSAENAKQLWVPEGFAHGFYVISKSAEFQYKCTDYYNPSNEETIQWNDSTLSIDWPLLDGDLPSLSVKDSNAQSFADAPKF